MATSNGRNESARLIGKAIAETLAPLVSSHKMDKQTNEVLSDLANQFETEGA